jgi:hypothetical protein
MLLFVSSLQSSEPDSDSAQPNHRNDEVSLPSFLFSFLFLSIRSFHFTSSSFLGCVRLFLSAGN